VQRSNDGAARPRTDTGSGQQHGVGPPGAAPPGASTHGPVPPRLAASPAGGQGGGSAALAGADAAVRLRGQDIYAALDLGTNNCRLLVARPSRRGFVVIDAFSRIIRLGEGIGQAGRLSDAAMQRTVDALKVCADKMSRRGVTRSRLVATEACRVTANGPDFIERVRTETGLDLEILEPETEARLALAGCVSLIDREAETALVFDIGGGSSEIIWLDGFEPASEQQRYAEPERRVVDWISLPVGVVTLSERFGGRRVTPEIYDGMVGHVRDMLGAFEQRNGIARRLQETRSHLLGTSGTVTTVAGIHLGLKLYDRAKVDGCWLASDDVTRVSHALLGCSYEERVAQPCIGPERADLVLAGCAILEAMMLQWPCERLRVADRGLREGILSQLMSEDGLYRARFQRPRQERR
jgi:exopolyphosphatase / guanosine-5'-triphosphate,3'-diphosphate pyrophosphatase